MMILTLAMEREGVRMIRNYGYPMIKRRESKREYCHLKGI